MRDVKSHVQFGVSDFGRVIASILNEKQETTTKVIWCLWKIHVLVFYTELP